MTATFNIRPLRFHEMNVPIAWAAREGWNPGLADQAAFWPVDPSGFIGGFLNNRLIATIAAVRYSDNFGFLGFYIVDPSYRAQGYGIQVWHAGLEHLAGVSCIGLDGVIDQQENYRNSGFVYAQVNIRYQGIVPIRLNRPPLAVGERMVPAIHIPLEMIAQFDALHFPTPRIEFLREWLVQPSHHATAIIRDNQVCAYGVVRRCVSGYKIGPLFCQTMTQAESLMYELCHDLEMDAPLFIDCPAQHKAAMELTKSLGMSQVFETARMYKGHSPTLMTDQIFGITTFELG